MNKGYVMHIGNQKHLGFTLIELVIVIVLVGILAATVLPKFVSLTTQARTASNRGVAGGLGAAVSIAHAAWIANGNVSPVTLDQTSVTLNANGWPDGGAASIATVSAAQCITLWSAVLNNPPQALVPASCTATTPTGCYQVTAAGAVCTFTLGASATTTITYSIASGAVTSAP